MPKKEATPPLTPEQEIKAAYSIMSSPGESPTYRQSKGKRLSFTVHPKARSLDRMPFDKFAELAADIASNGLRNPVLVHEGQIIDGFHRAAVCAATGTYMTVTTMPEVTTELDISKAIFSLNVRRREKPASIAKIALLTYEWFGSEAKAIAKANQGTRTDLLEDSPEGGSEFVGMNSAEIAIELAGAKGIVSERSVRDIANAVENAPQTRSKVHSGEITTITKAKEAAQAETGTEPDEPKPSTISAWKKLSNAKASIETGVKSAQAGQLGGTEAKPITLKDWQDRFWEIKALIADFETHVEFLFDSEPED